MKAESIIKRRVYDHRLRDYIRETGDVSFAVSLGVPRSTARSWLVAPIRSVVSHEVFDLNDVQVRARILKLERRVRILTAIMGLLLTLVRLSCTRLDGSRVPRGKDKSRLLRAIDRARVVLGLRSALKIVGLSATRFHSWIRSRESGCKLDDLTSCPKTNPRQLLAKGSSNNKGNGHIRRLPTRSNWGAVDIGSKTWQSICYACDLVSIRP